MKLTREQHRLSNSAEYKAFRNMWARCTTPSASGYENYGGRGIGVCAEWRSFSQFLKDMGPRPSSQHSLDRIDVNRNYAPDNCKWATKSEQQRNRRDNPRLTCKGRTQAVKDWAEQLGVTNATIMWRVKHWGIERALSIPASADHQQRRRTKATEF